MLILKEMLDFLIGTEVSCRKTIQELEGLGCCAQGHLIKADLCQCKLELSGESGKTEEFEHFKRLFSRGTNSMAYFFFWTEQVK